MKRVYDHFYGIVIGTGYEMLADTGVHKVTVWLLGTLIAL
jgi:hypothetical protein